MNSKIWLSGKKHLTVCNHNNLTDYDNQATNKNDPRASFCILHCIAYFIDRFVRISVNKIENVLNIPVIGATTDSIDGLKDDPDQFNVLRKIDSKPNTSQRELASLCLPLHDISMILSDSYLTRVMRRVMRQRPQRISYPIAYLAQNEAQNKTG